MLLIKKVTITTHFLIWLYLCCRDITSQGMAASVTQMATTGSQVRYPTLL